MSTFEESFNIVLDYVSDSRNPVSQLDAVRSYFATASDDTFELLRQKLDEIITNPPASQVIAIGNVMLADKRVPHIKTAIGIAMSMMPDTYRQYIIDALIQSEDTVFTPNFLTDLKKT